MDSYYLVVGVAFGQGLAWGLGGLIWFLLSL